MPLSLSVCPSFSPPKASDRARKGWERGEEVSRISVLSDGDLLDPLTAGFTQGQESKTKLKLIFHAGAKKAPLDLGYT